MDLTNDVALLLVRELHAFQREITLFPDDESVWRTLPGITNSAGNLTLHVSGNLRHFVGGVLGGSGYVRDREVEFGRRSGTRRELNAEIEAAIAVVKDVLARVPDDCFDREFPEPVGGIRVRAGLFLLHLCTHAAYHLGQVGYLRRALSGENQSSGALPLQPMALM